MVLQEHGLNMPMTKLAEELGIKRPTLLYYFPDRGAIAEHALESLLREQAVYVLARMNEHFHPLDQIYAQVCAIHDFHHGEEQRLIFLTQAIAATSRERLEAIIDVGNRVFEIHRRAMVSRLKAAMADGMMKKCDPEALMQLVRSVNDGLIVQRVMTGIDLDAVHAFLWNNVLAPLKVE